MKRQFWEKNRDVKRNPKKGKFWCYGCDHSLVWEGQKCPNCNKKNYKTKRNKK